MNRRPQPKTAANLITNLLARNNIDIPCSLALDVVATVEGYSDWNAMVADISGGNHLTPATLDGYVGPDVPKTDGPFTVYAGEVYYGKAITFAQACADASVLAFDNTDANGRLVRILDAKAEVRAAYLSEHATIHTYGGTVPDALPPMREMSSFIADTFDEEDVFVDHEQLRIFLCDSLDVALKDGDDGVFLGYRHYERTDGGRVINFDLPVVTAFYVTDGQVHINPELPDYLRLSLEVKIKN